MFIYALLPRRRGSAQRHHVVERVIYELAVAGSGDENEEERTRLAAEADCRRPCCPRHEMQPAFAEARGLMDNIASYAGFAFTSP